MKDNELTILDGNDFSGILSAALPLDDEQLTAAIVEQRKRAVLFGAVFLSKRPCFSTLKIEKTSARVR